METKRMGSSFLIFIVIMTVFVFSDSVFGQDKNLVVRIAKLQIDPVKLESYKAALKEQIETAVRMEPGVQTLYAVYEKNNPTHVTVFEIYADTDAYKAHLETAHFKKYKNATKEMVKSLELVETVPIALATKQK